ncbi:MAG: NAD-dependent deacylase [Anaerolineaceae bacterium]|nr:NAD-dependent deacylase [Anaerolineaceae bacterium]
MKETEQAELIRKASQLLSNSNYTVVLTGAGISTSSGIPDFRSQGTGLWQKNDPLEVASLTAFRYTPEKFFNWLRPLAKDIWQAKPNPAHIALAELEKAGWIKAIITQNIDGLHQAAGAENVVEVHGSATTLTCLSCRKSFPVSDFVQAFIIEGDMPHCPSCSKLLKPDIILFEEMLPMNAWSQAQYHCENADLILVIGSSLEVTPANSLPIYALENGAHLIINNYSSTYLDGQADVLLPVDIIEAIPGIAQNLL